MSFTRTNSGVSNMHLFYDADIVIYTEGGPKSFSQSEIEDGMFSSGSIDIKFWSGVFNANNFDKKAEFRAIGSKTSSRAIVQKILNGEIRNTAVAKDRDLDQYLEVFQSSPFILYTKGYSWENDVFEKELIVSQIKNMLLEPELSEAAILEIDAFYKRFNIIGKFLVKSEVLFRLNGQRFISDVKGEMFFNKKSSLIIDKDKILSLFRDKRSLINKPFNSRVNLNGICPYMNNYGKLIQAFAMNIINYICRKYSDCKSIPNRLVEFAMIERYSNKIRIDKDNYYSEMIVRLSSALRASNET